MSDNIKQELDTLWIKYQKTLEMLDQTLDELEQKPKEIQIPITEYVEVPKIVEVEIVKDISQDTRDSYELQIADLKEQLQTMRSRMLLKIIKHKIMNNHLQQIFKII